MEGHYCLYFVSVGVGDQTALPNSCIPKSMPVQEEISWDSFANGQSKSVNLQLKEKLYLLNKEVMKHMDGQWVKTSSYTTQAWTCLFQRLCLVPDQSNLVIQLNVMELEQKTGRVNKKQMHTQTSILFRFV